MARLVDNLIAYRVLYMLVTPFTDTQAYKLGIIDAEGKNLKKMSSLKTTEERDSYTYLHRLVFNLKKIINRLPGGESKLKNIVAAFWLVKEYYQRDDRSTALMEEHYTRILERVESGIVLAEEEVTVKKFLEGKLVDEEAVANVAGAGVATNEPAIKSKDVKKYQKLARRKAPVNVGA